MIKNQKYYQDKKVLLALFSLFSLTLLSVFLVAIKIDVSRATVGLVYFVAGGLPQFVNSPSIYGYVFAVYPLVITATSILVGWRLWASSKLLSRLSLVLANIVVLANILVANAVLSS